MSFQRARSEEQRLQRREWILTVAARLLSEASVAELTLNGLSREVGLAKSNILRYFESRGEILLTLLVRAARSWVDEVDRELTATVDPHTALAGRADTVAALLARTAATHTDLLDLLSAQSSVLEQNVSADGVLRFKQSAYAVITDLAAALTRVLPELGDGGLALCALIVTLAGAIYAQAQQSQACASAYAADPSLLAFRVELVPALTAAFGTVLAGTLARR